MLRLMQALRALLHGDADVNACKGHGTTALHWAGALSHVGAACELVAHDANIGICDINGYTAAELASMSGHDGLSVALSRGVL